MVVRPSKARYTVSLHQIRAQLYFRLCGVEWGGGEWGSGPGGGGEARQLLRPEVLRPMGYC